MRSEKQNAPRPEPRGVLAPRRAGRVLGHPWGNLLSRFVRRPAPPRLYAIFGRALLWAGSAPRSYDPVSLSEAPVPEVSQRPVSLKILLSFLRRVKV